MWRLSLSALLVAALVPAATSARPGTQKPGRPLLTYVPPSGGLCLVRADGTHRVRLTSYVAGWPSWTPGGRYVGYVESRSGLGTIAFANARGRFLWRLVGNNLGNPLLSPDGRHMVYAWVNPAPPRGYGFIVSRLNGSDGHGIGGSMDPRGEVVGPTFAPDGQSVAFTGGPRFPPAVGGIYTIPVDGGNWRLLIRGARKPAYSPDGTRIAYVASADSSRLGVFVAGADGSDPRLLDPSAQADWPSWSPDGMKVAFQRGSELVVARADGSGEQVVASGLAPQPYSRLFAWSPGGKLIAFERGSSLLVVGADGRGERVVVRRVDPATGTPPAWRAPVALPHAKRSRC